MFVNQITNSSRLLAKKKPGLQLKMAAQNQDLGPHEQVSVQNKTQGAKSVICESPVEACLVQSWWIPCQSHLQMASSSCAWSDLQPPDHKIRPAEFFASSEQPGVVPETVALLMLLPRTQQAKRFSHWVDGCVGVGATRKQLMPVSHRMRPAFRYNTSQWNLRRRDTSGRTLCETDRTRSTPTRTHNARETATRSPRVVLVLRLEDTSFGPPRASRYPAPKSSLPDSLCLPKPEENQTSEPRPEQS